MELRTILLPLMLLTISGCSTLGGFLGREEPKPIPVEIKTVEVKIPITHPTLPRGLDLREPQWYVVSDKNIDEFLERIAKENAGQVVFLAMSVQDYELMAYNMQEIKRYVNQMKEVIVYYRTVNDVPKDVEEEVGETDESTN